MGTPFIAQSVESRQQPCTTEYNTDAIIISTGASYFRAVNEGLLVKFQGNSPLTQTHEKVPTLQYQQTLFTQSKSEMPLYPQSNLCKVYSPTETLSYEMGTIYLFRRYGRAL